MTEKEPLAQMLRESGCKPALSCELCTNLRGGKACDEIKCTDGLLFLADRIEAELDQARKSAAERIVPPMKVISRLVDSGAGWPAPKEGEGLRKWLDRCFLPRPCFEDGEPVQWGDIAKVRDDLGEVHQMLFSDSGCQEVVIGFEGDSSATHYMCVDGERVKRAVPEVLYVDGVPVKVGDSVWYAKCPERRGTVTGVGWGDGKYTKNRNCLVLWDGCASPFWEQSDRLTHKKPETMECIRKDAAKDFRSYWSCYGVCTDCPSKIDGKEPWRRYGLSRCDCGGAQKLDLVARAEKLLGGGE